MVIAPASRPSSSQDGTIRPDHKSPRIRFSVEPVGDEAETAKDPRNELVAGKFCKALLKEFPAIKL